VSEELAIAEVAGAVRFAVHVQPRASRDQVAGVHGNALKVRLSAPPVDGAANAALIALIATQLNVRRANVRIVAGAQSRGKIVEVAGVTAAEVRRLASNSERK
jgi:uncharacterized protein (TIGR00251 family)